MPEDSAQQPYMFRGRGATADDGDSDPSGRRFRDVEGIEHTPTIQDGWQSADRERSAVARHRPDDLTVRAKHVDLGERVRTEQGNERGTDGPQPLLFGRS